MLPSRLQRGFLLGVLTTRSLLDTILHVCNNETLVRTKNDHFCYNKILFEDLKNMIIVNMAPTRNQHKGSIEAQGSPKPYTRKPKP